MLDELNRGLTEFQKNWSELLDGRENRDFFEQESASDGVDAKTIVTNEPNLEWTEESNGDHCKWISIWFEGIEAKLHSDTVLDICAEELQAVRDQILADGGRET